MQALVSLDRAPPLDAPLRFLLTAPLMAVLAALVLLVQGPDLWASRWSPGALAVTHLITAGFMLQVMLGALQQLLPVIVGAQIRHPRAVAAVVHASISAGVLCLAAGFLQAGAFWFGVAALLLGLGVGVFVLASAQALWRLPPSTPTVTGIQLALVGLVLTVGLGVLMALTLAGMESLALPLMQVVNIHLGWGFVGWGCALLGAVALVVVPMFQMTPDYPRWFARWFAWTALAVLAAWSVAEWWRWPVLADVLGVAVATVAVCLALATYSLQRRSKRVGTDAIAQLWNVAMASTLLASALWAMGRMVPQWVQWTEWPVLVGVLALFGGFVSVMTGMLYKIVPFLVWLHLQNLSAGRLMPPNIKKVLPQRHIDRQTRAHWVSLALLVGAALWPTLLAYPAALALLVAQAWLARNLWSVLPVYRAHLQALAALETPAPKKASP
ncbi:MAG: permease [Rhodoferax sp.]